MLKAILLDLDDTLLGNDMDRFMPAYFDLISQYAQEIMAKKQFLQELMICTQVMIENTDPTFTNRDVFWHAFGQRNSLDPALLEPFFEQFYLTEFHQLKSVTQFRPTAVKLVRACVDLGLNIVIATNPLFPRVAIEERLAWAGVPVTEYDYALVTTYENMHAAKPHPAYFAEILQRINCAPEAALMVGDSWELDIVPAAEVGMHTYWLPGHGATGGNISTFSSSSVPTASGTLEDLYTRIQDGWLIPRTDKAQV